ncbi:MAG TPA: TIGR04190 family B12-binding domain/radical SAM domain protein, partial [Thermoproteales archaeon]|nr:TIGR04190 family B12-binding domain/radical SAM domain protein [Thermoproteales archaeon]
MLDLALIHPPSVYDFRKIPWKHYGPISDVVPSTPVFDMYPIGFFSLASYLEERGFKVGIYNLAARMVKDDNFNAEKLLKSIEARVYGIDLHWLVHAHGAIEIAKILKKQGKGPVILGGLSATYYWREILSKFEFIDYIVLGDTTEPVIEKFLEGKRVEELPNIAYRRNGIPVSTGLKFVPERLDNYAPKYGLLVKSMARTSIKNSTPYSLFFKYPITAVLQFKGCLLNCLTCGGSNYTFRTFFNRSKLGVKSVETVVQEVKELAERFKVTIFLIGDIRLPGKKYYEELLKRLHEEKIDNRVMFEFFTPPSQEVISEISKSVEQPIIQISPDAWEDDWRQVIGRNYTNQDLIKFLEKASPLVDRIDVYFMTGLPGQNLDSVKGFKNLVEEICKIENIEVFAAPLAPFVDPGSRAFVNPHEYGYNLLAKTLEEHRKLLLADEWFKMLNYETKWLKREEIALLSYNVVEKLYKIKLEKGIISEEEFKKLTESIKQARERRNKKLT